MENLKPATAITIGFIILVVALVIPGAPGIAALYLAGLCHGAGMLQSYIKKAQRLEK